jgi:uncharacterized membrane protein YbhN (UPF0104 family)
MPAIERPQLIAGALALYAAALLGYAFVWRTVVRRLDRFHPPLIDSLAVFFASWLGRYVPTSLPYLAGKVAMGMRLGHSKSALAASVLYENGLIIAIGALSSCAILPVVLTGNQGPLRFVVLGLGGAAALALLSPPAFRRLLAFAARLTGKQLPERMVLSPAGLVAASAFAIAVLVCNGTSFALVLDSFVALDGRELVATAAIFNLAGIVGTLVLPVPSGLGVREAVIVTLVQLYAPLEAAAAAAVVARLIGLGVDVAFGLAGAAWYAYRQSSYAGGLAGEQAKAA